MLKRIIEAVAIAALSEVFRRSIERVEKWWDERNPQDSDDTESEGTP